MNVCLVSLTPSHYRKRIYQLMEEDFGCEFVFGKGRTSVQSMDLSVLRKVELVPNLSIGSGRWCKMPGAFKYLKKYDIIVNDMGILCTTSWRLMLQSKILKQKVYLWDHGWYGREGFAKKWMKRLYFGLADGAFVYGNYAKNLMIRNGFDGSKLFVIHNSLDYENQVKLRTELESTPIFKEHFRNDNPNLFFIGRLTPIKKLDQILRAMVICRQKGHEYNMTFIGGGEKNEELQRLAIEFGLQGNVWFYGPCYDEKELGNLIYNADLCVAPGNIGLTAMHSMVFGTPCITHNNFPYQMPEFEAIQPYKTGNFFEMDNVEDLASKIDEWFVVDGPLREEIRQNCFKEIDENWNPSFQIEIIKNALDYE